MGLRVPRVAQHVRSRLDRLWLFLCRTAEDRGAVIARRSMHHPPFLSKENRENSGLPPYLLLSMPALEKAGLKKIPLRITLGIHAALTWV